MPCRARATIVLPDFARSLFADGKETSIDGLVILPEGGGEWV